MKIVCILPKKIVDTEKVDFGSDNQLRIVILTKKSIFQ